VIFGKERLEEREEDLENRIKRIEEIEFVFELELDF